MVKVCFEVPLRIVLLYKPTCKKCIRPKKVQVERSHHHKSVWIDDILMCRDKDVKDTVMTTEDRDSMIRLWLAPTVLTDRRNKEDEECRITSASLLVLLQ